MKKIVAALCFSIAAFGANAWEGYDSESGESVTIEKGNLVRRGEEIEVYNNDSGEYEYHTVENIYRRGGTVEVETYDYDSGEYRTLEMDD